MNEKETSAKELHELLDNLKKTYRPVISLEEWLLNEGHYSLIDREKEQP
jgi:hypothetical protein